MKVIDVARICHEANRAYCRTIGDFSQLSWDNAPQWQKESAFDGVRFHLNNPDATDSASHENWLKQKDEDGWEYGAEKNEVLKTHPCIVSFEDLPVEQQLKDRIFRRIVHIFVGYIED